MYLAFVVLMQLNYFMGWINYIVWIAVYFILSTFFAAYISIRYKRLSYVKIVICLVKSNTSILCIYVNKKPALLISVKPAITKP